MGIYDREYYRREGPSALDWLPSGNVCKTLILINVAVFVLQLLVPAPADPELAFGPQRSPRSPVTSYLLLDAADVFHGQVWRLLTYGFLHDPRTLWHIFFNMLFLWMFGSDLEQLYGRGEFLAFYLAAVLAGGWAYIVQGLLRGVNYQCLGASGAITAILVLYAFHFPTRTILLFFVLPVPVWALAVFQVVQDSFFVLANRDTGVAFAVHLGGAAFAAAYYLGQWRLLGVWEHLRSWKIRRSRPRLRVFQPPDSEPAERRLDSPLTLSQMDEQLEAKVDVVLEKVAKFGQDSLSESERQILMRASEIYRKRRN